MHDVIVVGGGFCGVITAREAALRGCDVLLLEARERLGGRTWSAEWNGQNVEYGGAWVHWHQPHTWSELTRAGLRVLLSPEAESATWYVGDERRSGSMAERDAIARRGWDAFVAGAGAMLPLPHDPRHAMGELARLDRLTIAERLAELPLSLEEHEVLAAELESLAHAPLDDAGAVAVLRWHALSGYSLALTQFTGGRVTIAAGTAALLQAIACGAAFEYLLETPVAAVRRRRDGGVEVETRSGECFTALAVVVTAPLNTLGGIEFTPPLPEDKRQGVALGQASRGVKLFIRATGRRVLHNAVRAGHPFGYIDTEALNDDGSQMMIAFGADGHLCDPADREEIQRHLDRLVPGYRVLDAAAHDWLRDEFSLGTWAIHRPGWYEHHYEAMCRPEGPLMLAGSDLAAGWAGFIDGAIESGLRAGAWAAATVGTASTLSRSG